MSADSSYKSGLSFHPRKGLEHVIVSDLDISGRLSGWAATKHYVFPGSFQEIINDLVWAHGMSVDATVDGLSVGAGPRYSDAMEICKEGIDNGNVRTPSQLYPANGFIVGCAMEPNSVINDLAANSAGGRGGKCINQANTYDPRQFQADQAVMACTGSKHYGPARQAPIHYQFG
jgi:hypothetical protein